MPRNNSINVPHLPLPGHDLGRDSNVANQLDKGKPPQQKSDVQEFTLPLWKQQFPFLLFLRNLPSHFQAAI